MRVPFVVVDADLSLADADDAVALRGEQLHHLGRVLRRGAGDPLEVTDGAGRVADGVLTADGVRLVGRPRFVARASPTVEVVHALPKGRAMDDVVRSLCELGVDRIRPVLTARTESRPVGAKATLVTERLRSVALQAAQQARSAHLCVVDHVALLALTQRDDDPHHLRLLAHPGAPVGIGEIVRAGQDGAPTEAVSVLIGPEGGMTESEVEDLVAVGWVAARAGETVLRTVNAGVVLTAAVMALTGRFDRPITHDPPDA
jgi:16S rRNA (uracil1498-N3)-methyltransferase